MVPTVCQTFNIVTNYFSIISHAYLIIYLFIYLFVCLFIYLLRERVCVCERDLNFECTVHVYWLTILVTWG